MAKRRLTDEQRKENRRPIQKRAMAKLALRGKLVIQGAKNYPCIDCHGRFPPCAMDFDHVRDTKRHNVGAMNSWSVAAILTEIAKCELVCANCHRIRTEERRKAASAK